ncbi:putative membrane protein [Rhodobium orientis]|uniref:DUF2269 domain-containing protein n=1 Tax=Rhodobium orientis TaxID=34017 RepID=A0A327JF61_9HYPH|nr:DUF2269 domain-containing protein [Rhodobium orientis]MBB4305498.1 putative membrane protein [Rhodobium orientis]MBK5949862.1 hypothetical protein [Rhodobium orientis]RAI24735.1 hypothetical protein CH339_21445 [Rhodobium orientis]
MELFQILRLLHILGAAVLFGTGMGIAFFMVLAHRTGDPKLIAHVASGVVLADALFTATAVIAQPVTGIWLAYEMGHDLLSSWIVVAVALYLVTGTFWLPVVVIQMKMRDLARKAAAEGAPLPATYHRLFRIWFGFGWPAFAAVLAIFGVMIARPDFW